MSTVDLLRAGLDLVTGRPVDSGMSSWDSLDSKWLLCQPQDYSTLGANYDNLSYFNGLVPSTDGLVPSEDQD